MDLSKSLYRIAESAFGMLRNDECGFTEEEERIVQRNLLYWMERKHHFDEQLGRACIANIYYFDDDVERPIKNKIFSKYDITGIIIKKYEKYNTVQYLPKLMKGGST